MSLKDAEALAALYPGSRVEKRIRIEYENIERGRET